MAKPGHRTGAILLIVFAATLAPVGDVFAKMLTLTYGAVFICFGRFMVGGLIGYSALRLTGRYVQPPARVMVEHLLRAGLLAGSVMLLTLGLARAPIADVMAGFYLAPMIAAAAGAAILGEAMSTQKSLGAALSLFGAIAIINPSGDFSVGAAMAIGSGICFAAYLLIAKIAPLQEDGASAAVTQSLIAGLLTAPLALLAPPAMPSGWVFLAFIAAGAVSIVCQSATLIAHRYADASTLAPFFYTALISSLLLGVVVFGDLPGPSSMLGILTIACGGILTVWDRPARLSTAA